MRQLSCPVLLLSAICAALLSAQESEPFFHWKVIPGTRRCELYASGHKIGLWDADKKRYYRVTPNGKLTGPVPPPFPILDPAEVAKREEQSPAQNQPRDSAEEEPPWYAGLPPWVSSLSGVVVTVLIVSVGLILQQRRNRPRGGAVS